MRRIMLVMFAAIFLIASFATAEEKIKEDAADLDKVVVESTRIDNTFHPLNVSGADREELRQMTPATSDTANLLKDIPGVSINKAGGVSSQPAIHGMADDRLRIKVDGMDIISSCPNHMNSPLSYVDPANVGSIKVFAGITPVSVGGDSIGGTIVVNTPEPVFAGPGQGTILNGEAGAFYRSNGDGISGNLSTTMATENFSVTYSGAAAKSDNYKAADDFKTTDATGRAGP